MNVEVNFLAVVLAALSSFVVGMIWYSKPVFGTSWMKMVGMTDKKAEKGMAKAMGFSFFAALLTAYIVAYMGYIANAFFTDNSFLINAVNTSFWLGVGIAATTIVTHDAFEQRDMKLTAMNMGNQVVTILTMGLIIGLMGL